MAAIVEKSATLSKDPVTFVILIMIFGVLVELLPIVIIRSYRKRYR